MKNGIYLSPQSRNELVDRIDISNIQKVFINDIKESKLHSMMADEVIVRDDEVVPMCFRYVDPKKDIQKVFFEFFDVERISDTVIGNDMLDFLESKEHPVEDCIGQRYDGAPNMQLEKKGMASFISEKALQAAVTHCSSHNLNLALAKDAKIQTTEKITAVEGNTNILQYFSKTRQPLEYIVKLRCNTSSKNGSVFLECARLGGLSEIHFMNVSTLLCYICLAFNDCHVS